MNNIRKAIEEKIKELERKNNLRSLEVIDWLKELLKLLPEEKKEEVKPTKITVEIPDEEYVAEDVPTMPVEKPKKKIVFTKKK